MSEPPDPPIVVTGGSVNVEVDETLLAPNGKTAKGLNKFTNADSKITRVVVTIGDTTKTFDVPNGKVRVEIYCGNNKS